MLFWQKSGFKFWSSLTNEITTSKISPSISKYAAAKARQQLEGANAIDHSSKKIEAQHWTFEHFYILILCDFKNKSGQVVHQETVKLNGLKGVAFTIRKILIHSFKDNAFSEELMPYMLFFAAISAPIWSA